MDVKKNCLHCQKEFWTTKAGLYCEDNHGQQFRRAQKAREAKISDAITALQTEIELAKRGAPLRNEYETLVLLDTANAYLTLVEKRQAQKRAKR